MLSATYLSRLELYGLMKASFDTLFLTFLVSIIAFSARPVQGQDWARKMFAETAHNFGDVTKGEIPEYRFEFENLYQEELVIERVSTSCACVTVSLADGKNVLKSKEKGAVVCKFNSPAFDGQRQATVTIRFRRPFIAEVQLNLKGNIIRGVSFSPSSIDFGQVVESNLPVKTVKISSSSSPSFRVVDVKSTFPHVGVQLRETARSAGLVSYEMSVRIKPTVPGGFTQGELYVLVQEGNVTRQIPLKFNVRVVNPLQLPESITLGPVVAGTEASRKVILKSDREFKVTDVTCENTSFRVKADTQAKKVHFVEVVFSANGNPGEYQEELSFFIDNVTEPAGKLKVYVEVVAADRPASPKTDS